MGLAEVVDAKWAFLIVGLVVGAIVAVLALKGKERMLALPGMRRDGGGRIVNVSSIAGDVNGPLLGWYEAAKQALSSVSDALRPEVAGYGVEVVLVEPGPCATPLWDKARDYLARRRADALEPDVYDRSIELVDGVAARAGDPQEVAHVIGAALHAGRQRFRYRGR